jgi:type IV pilus assembly protein PilM
MNINIISNGVSVLARDIVVGSEQLTEQLANKLNVDLASAEKIKLGKELCQDNQDEITNIFNQTCTQWVLEIKKAIDLYFANNPDSPLQSLVLSGGGSKVNGLAEYIGEETGLNVIMFNPFEKMTYDEKKFDPDYIHLVAPEMTIAAGLAIRQSPF